MADTPSAPGGDEQDLERDAVREVEAAVSRLAQRYEQRDPEVAAALQREARILRDLLAGHPPPSGGVRGSLRRLHDLYRSVLVGSLDEETKDASLLMLLNRLLGV